MWADAPTTGAFLFVYTFFIAASACVETCLTSALTKSVDRE
eukprot:gene4834-6586_t